MANNKQKKNPSVNVTFTDNVKGELSMPLYFIGSIIHFSENSAFRGRESAENLFEAKEFEGHKYDILQGVEGDISLKQLLRKGNGIPFKDTTIEQRCLEIRDKVMSPKGWCLKITQLRNRPMGESSQTLCLFEELQG